MSQIAIDPPKAHTTEFIVLGAASACHLLNDMMQSLFLATYPIFKGGFHLSFGEIGLLTLTYQLSASILQPLIGLYTDKRPLPYSLPFAMGFSLTGLLTLAFAPTYAFLLLGSTLLGVGSSIFHPETSRIARLASGGSHGLAQSIFQIGGNLGTSLGPLLVAFIVLPNGQSSLAWFAFAALGGLVLMTGLARWSAAHGSARSRSSGSRVRETSLSAGQVRGAVAVLVALMLSKWVYLASFTSYYIFYLMHHFHLAEREAQVFLFVFLASVAVGTVLGGPVGDRIGRRRVVWGSILGVLPLTVALPHVDLSVTVTLSVVIGLMLASAFPSIVVYAQDLMPGRVGMVSGLFFGLAFGLGGLGAAVLGMLADRAGIDFVYQVCSFLPAIGLLAAFLPELDRPGSLSAGRRRSPAT